jgi:hypothetical protein
MVVQRPVPPRCRRPGEIERAAHRPARREDGDGLDDIGVAAFLVLRDLGGQRTDIDRGVGERRQRGPQHLGGDGRQVALQVHCHIVPFVRVEFLQGPEHPVRTGRQPGVGQDRGTAGGADGVGDDLLGRGDQDRPDLRLDRAAPDVDDHRLAMDVGQRLVGQPGGGESRGNDDDGVARGAHAGAAIRCLVADGC